jgi:hypothetical protein
MQMEYSKLASNSMKHLTERVIKADLASRKTKVIHYRIAQFVGMLWIIPGLYGIMVYK